MAWYDVPQVDCVYLYDEEGVAIGVKFKAKNFEKLAEKMEDFHDVVAIETAKIKTKKIYSFHEIKKMIESKRK